MTGRSLIGVNKTQMSWADFAYLFLCMVSFPFNLSYAQSVASVWDILRGAPAASDHGTANIWAAVSPRCPAVSSGRLECQTPLPLLHKTVAPSHLLSASTPVNSHMCATLLRSAVMEFLALVCVSASQNLFMPRCRQPGSKTLKMGLIVFVKWIGGLFFFCNLPTFLEDCLSWLQAGC